MLQSTSKSLLNLIATNAWYVVLLENFDDIFNVSNLCFQFFYDIFKATFAERRIVEDIDELNKLFQFIRLCPLLLCCKVRANINLLL